MSKNKQVRICTLPLPLCPSMLPLLSTETGAACSVVFFTAYEDVINVINVYYWYVDRKVFSIPER